MHTPLVCSSTGFFLTRPSVTSYVASASWEVSQHPRSLILRAAAWYHSLIYPNEIILFFPPRHGKRAWDNMKPMWWRKTVIDAAGNAVVWHAPCVTTQRHLLWGKQVCRAQTKNSAGLQTPPSLKEPPKNKKTPPAVKLLQLFPSTLTFILNGYVHLVLDIGYGLGHGTYVKQ